MKYIEKSKIREVFYTFDEDPDSCATLQGVIEGLVEEDKVINPVDLFYYLRVSKLEDDFMKIVGALEQMFFSKDFTNENVTKCVALFRKGLLQGADEATEYMRSVVQSEINMVMRECIP